MKTAPSPSALRPSQSQLVEVWRLPVGGCSKPIPGAGEHLSPEEEIRLRRIVSATRQQRIRAAWSARRAILGRAFDCDPHDVAIRRAPDGSSFAESPHQALHVSLSHSGAWMLFALSRTARVGVDIERVNPAANGLRLARRFFHSNEAERLALLSHDRRSLEFFRAWSRKEALLKATGGGVPSRLRSVPSGLDNASEPLSWAGATWIVLDLEAPESYVASLAAGGSAPPEVQLHDEI